MGDDRAVVYEDGGVVTYRASGLGGCLTALAAALRGMDKVGHKAGGRVAETYAAGHRAEDEFFERNPHLATNRQKEVVLWVTDKIRVVAHLDAYVNDTIVEVKSQSGKEYGKWDGWDNDLWWKYAWQISVGMVALPDAKYCHVYRWNRETKKQSLEIVYRPFYSRDEIIERVLEVEALAGEDKLVCKTPNFFCDYPGLHERAELIEDEELEELAAEYVRLGKVEKGAKERREEIRGQILTRMEGREKVLLMNGVTVSVSEFDTQDRIQAGGHVVRLTVK